MSKILVLGGYGGFGGRLSRRLSAAGHEVLVAGRRFQQAEQFCALVARCTPLTADRNSDIGPLLARHKPALVIDAAGPFQNSDYRVPEACLAAQVSYLDLADGRAFVAGMARLNADACHASVTVLTGASTVPALSGAVIRQLVKGMDKITAVEMAISGSNRSTAGASVAKAIFTYVGKPICLWRGQRTVKSFGLQEMRIEAFDFADGLSLGRRLVGLADVPDLTLLPKRVNGSPAVSFRAGTELNFQNLALWLLSWPVRWRWLASVAAFSNAFLALHRATRFLGSERSGMVVRIFGVFGGRRIERRWTLVASDGHGPEIPTLPAVLLAQRVLSGKETPGARDAGEALELGDFASSFAAMSVKQEIRDILQPDALYRRVMGPRFDKLAPSVQEMHGFLRDGGAVGEATVTRGGGLVGRLIGWIMAFPPAGDHKLHVAFSEQNGGERWTRYFSETSFASDLSQGGRHLIERFGPLSFHFELPNEGNGLCMKMRRWSFLGIPLPQFLAPRSEAREWDEKGIFQFDVPIAMPLIGDIVRYRGWLKPNAG